MSISQLGPYRVLREHARSYSGVVYEALDQLHQRKVVLTDCTGDLAAEEVLQRLKDEARTFTLLSHPNIARVIGFSRHDERVYLVTEFIEGATLEEILSQRGRMPLGMVIPLFRQIMAGVAAAHRLGVVHGNLTPANIAIPDFGPVKILDVAFERAFGPASPIHEKSTPRYLSPEQIEGLSPDARSDIYSLGLMLYESILGRSPFDAYGEVGAGRAAQAQLIPTSPSLILDDIPDWLDELLLRMIAPAPANRFQSVQAIMQFVDSRFALKSSPKEREWTAKKAISDRVARVNGRLRGSLKRTATAVRSNWHGFLTLFERACANDAGRLSNLSSASRRRASKLWTETRESLQSVASRSTVKAAGLLILIAVETFYFRGAHVSLLLEAGTWSRPSLSDSVDAMFARLDRDVSPRQVQSVASQKRSMPQGNQPWPARRVDRTGLNEINNELSPRNEISSVEERRAVRSAHNSSEPSKRLPVSLSSNRLTEQSKTEQNARSLETVHVSNRKEPEATEPVKPAQTVAPAARLKIRWEN